MSLVRRLLALVVACVVLAGCRVDGDVTVRVADDGSGTVQVAVTFDADAAARVPDLAGTLRTQDLEAAGWTITAPETAPDGSVVVRAQKAFASPEQLPAVLAEVSGVFGQVQLERSRSFGKVTWTFDGQINVTGGAARFGDEQLATLLGGRPLGRDVANLEQEIGAPLADSTSLGMTLAMPGGTTQHWSVRLDQSAPLPVHATSTLRRAGALVWAAVAIAAAGLLLLLLVLRILRGGRRRRARKGFDAAPRPLTADSPIETSAPPVAVDAAPRRLQLVVTAAHGVLWESQVSAEEWLGSLVSMQGGTPDAQRAHALVREAMLGRIRSADLWRALAVRGDPAELDAAYAARFTLDPDVVDFATALARRGIGVACVSNDVAEWSALVRARFGLDRFIRPFVLSAEVGALIPAPSLFEEVMTRAGIPPGNCLYIDDDVANLDVARDLGMSTVLLGPSFELADESGHGHAADLRDLLLRRGERVRR